MSCTIFSTSRRTSMWPRPCSHSTQPTGKVDLGVSKFRPLFPMSATDQEPRWPSGAPRDLDESRPCGLSEPGGGDRDREMGVMP